MTDEQDTKDGRAKRMAVRFTDEDLAFLAENAEDEGVEPATLVRMIVSRLRKGRAPLISMMEQQQPRQLAPNVPGPMAMRVTLTPRQMPGSHPQQPEASVDEDAADDVLNQRLAELDDADVVQLHQPEAEAVATPIVRIARQQYNPGRR